MPVCAEVEYRLVGTGAALLQGVPLPTGDIDILVKERAHVDAFGSALASYRCLFAPAWMPEDRQYYALVSCGPYTIPAVALELRLVSELLRDRPDRSTPLIQHMGVNGCDTELVRRGMEARSLPQALQEHVLGQLKTESVD